MRTIRGRTAEDRVAPGRDGAARDQSQPGRGCFAVGGARHANRRIRKTLGYLRVFCYSQSVNKARANGIEMKKQLKAETGRWVMEIKGCPFCNAAAELVRTKDGSGYWFAQCKGWNCGARIFARPTFEEAGEFWNKRGTINA